MRCTQSKRRFASDRHKWRREEAAQERSGWEWVVVLEALRSVVFNPAGLVSPAECPLACRAHGWGDSYSSGTCSTRVTARVGRCATYSIRCNAAETDLRVRT